MAHTLSEHSNTGGGDYIGPYQLIRPLGEGGMGEVHLSRRADGQYSKLVAVKRLQGNRAKLRERFYAERQILARLTHPNIAALLDGGETESGELYVVMEYVDGEPLPDYAARHNLGIKQRLKLFLQICSAVRHAHRNLIVHRDLKPSNILVTHDGTVKLIDFGIAKILFPDDSEMPSVETQTGEVMLTPLYASPEQVRGGPISTASDVYSLGVVLFELLAGTPPYAGNPHGPALAEAICTRPPLSLGAAAQKPEWRAALAGDLETIAAMALRKEPERRYSSVEQMAADIERHLEGFPVSARPDTIGYRASRFLSRNRGMAAGAAVTIALLVASSVVNYRTARRAEQERDTARVVADFMASIFEAPSPSVSFAKQVTARDLLARGEARINEELKSKPEVQARLLMIMARTQKELGDPARAVALYDQAIPLLTTLRGPNDPTVAEALSEKGRALQAEGKYAAAESLLRQALTVQRATLGDQHAETFQTIVLLTLALERLGRFEECAALLLPAIAAREQKFGPGVLLTDSVYRESLAIQSLVLTDLGRFDECEAVRRKLVEADLKVKGERSPEYVQSLASLGSSLRDRDADEEAEPLLRRAYQLQRSAVNSGSPDLLHVMQYLAICLQKMGRFPESEALWNQLRPQRIQLLGEKDRFVATDWIWWGDLLRRKGDLAGAEAAIRKGHAIRSAALPPSHRTHAQTYGMLGRVLRDKGDLTGAEHNLRLAYDLIQKLHGAANPRTTATAALDLGQVLHRMGRVPEAEELLRQAFESRKSLPADDRQRADATAAYGHFLVATGRTAEGQNLISAR